MIWNKYKAKNLDACLFIKVITKKGPFTKKEYQQIGDCLTWQLFEFQYLIKFFMLFPNFEKEKFLNFKNISFFLLKLINLGVL